MTTTSTTTTSPAEATTTASTTAAITTVTTTAASSILATTSSTKAATALTTATLMNLVLPGKVTLMNLRTVSKTTTTTTMIPTNGDVSGVFATGSFNLSVKSPVAFAIDVSFADALRAGIATAAGCKESQVLFSQLGATIISPDGTSVESLHSDSTRRLANLWIASAKVSYKIVRVTEHDRLKLKSVGTSTLTEAISGELRKVNENFISDVTSADAPTIHTEPVLQETTSRAIRSASHLVPMLIAGLWYLGLSMPHATSGHP